MRSENPQRLTAVIQTIAPTAPHAWPRGPVRTAGWLALCSWLALLPTSCKGDDEPASGDNNVCVRELNGCQCGDPSEISLIGDPESACPGSVPEGPHRCCRSADRCYCMPYVCIGGLTNQCTCQYAFNPVRPFRCLTAAAKLASQSSDPGAGEHCCATIGDDAGRCQCSPSECQVGTMEVSECSPDTALGVCPSGSTEVASCTN
jgi:hypothetical protein